MIEKGFTHGNRKKRPLWSSAILFVSTARYGVKSIATYVT